MPLLCKSPSDHVTYQPHQVAANTSLIIQTVTKLSNHISHSLNFSSVTHIFLSMSFLLGLLSAPMSSTISIFRPNCSQLCGLNQNDTFIMRIIFLLKIHLHSTSSSIALLTCTRPLRHLITFSLVILTCKITLASPTTFNTMPHHSRLPRNVHSVNNAVPLTWPKVEV